MGGRKQLQEYELKILHLRGAADSLQPLKLQA